MRYVPKEGIILARICEENVLITASRYRKTCPRAVQINETAAEIWKCLEEHKTEEEIIRYFEENYEAEDTDISDMIREFEESLYKKGYLEYEEAE